MDHEEKFDEPFPEAEDVSGGDGNIGLKIPRDWPSKGLIEFRGVTVRYDPDGPDILSNINLTIRPGERIAVVGRTGSGKSTVSGYRFSFTH